MSSEMQVFAGESQLELVEGSVLDIESKNIEVGEYGLTFKGQLTIEEWHEAVLGLQAFDGKIQWYLGDLAVYAESPVTGWGESKYADLIETTGYEYQTLRNYANVARRFTKEFRESVLSKVQVPSHLSFAHFAQVASLEDNYAKDFLERAAKSKWGVARLRAEINAWKIVHFGLEPDNEDINTTQTLSQRFKDAWTRIRDVAVNEEAELVRIQVVKNGMVIEEELVEM